jgi:hypothetical protein
VCVAVKNKCYTIKMAMELSVQAYGMCAHADSSALHALLDAHPGIDLYLCEEEVGSTSWVQQPFMNRQSAYKFC